jgi:hypothetical protein
LGLVGFVSGEAEEGVSYGYFRTVSDIQVVQLQCSINGDAPVGDDLVFEMYVDGVASGHEITVASGETHAVIDIVAESIESDVVISFVCKNVGSSEAGSWIELRIGYIA